MPSSKVVLPNFGLGLGYTKFQPGGYAIATNADTRFGYLGPGLREEADMTGIAAGFRVIRIIRHNDVPIAITTDGTDSKIYRVEGGAWALKETKTGAVCTDVVSFNDGTDSILAWCFGASVAFRYSTNDGTAWTASTLSGNAKNANYFLNQQSGLLQPRMLWVRNPSSLYFGDSLDNSANITTATQVGDAGTDEYFTCLTDDDSGVVLIGKRRYLYSLDADGVPIRLQGPFNDPAGDAGGQCDRRNFENPIKIMGRIWFPIEGYRLAEWYHGGWRDDMAPAQFVDTGPAAIPRVNLPINALGVAGRWVIVALGNKNSANLSVVNRPGGSQLLSNTFATTSELYVGSYISTDQGTAFRWHGSILTCSKALRGMWFNEDDSYLYMASGDSESVNVQQVRALFYTDDPEAHTVGGVVKLNTGTVTCEVLGITLGTPFDPETFEGIRCKTTGLGSTTPSLAVKYRAEQLYDTASGYTTLDTYTSNARAELGTRAPHTKSGQTFNLQFVVSNNASSNTYGLVYGAELAAGAFAKRRAMGVL